MIELGKYNTLGVVRRTPHGFYLGNDEEEVLLPNKYIPNELAIGQTIEVFVYLDFEERIVATTLKPKIQLHEFACLKVIDVNKVGAFLDWGLEKDLMVPFSEQAKNMRVDAFYLVYLYLDADSNRLVASSKIDQFLEKEAVNVAVGEKVDLLIGVASPIGVTVIINNRYRGLVFNNQIFRKIYPGEKTEGYIKEIREDNRIDVSLQPMGYKNIESSAEIILNKLRSNKGFLNLNDNSRPEEIKEKLQMSKKTYKKTIGALYKQKLISIEDDGIHLTEK